MPLEHIRRMLDPLDIFAHVAANWDKPDFQNSLVKHILYGNPVKFNDNAPAEARRRQRIDQYNQHRQNIYRARKRSFESRLYRQSFERPSGFYRKRYYSSNRRRSRRRKFQRKSFVF